MDADWLQMPIKSIIQVVELLKKKFTPLRVVIRGVTLHKGLAINMIFNGVKLTILTWESKGID